MHSARKAFATALALGLVCASWACSGASTDADLFAPSGVDQEPDAGEAASDDADADAGRRGDARTAITADAGAGDALVEHDAGGDAGGQDGGADCGAPSVLHPRNVGTGVYCPFRSGGPNCGVGEHCCQPFTGSSVCAASCVAAKTATDAGVAFTGTDWECQTPNDCVSGVCCGSTQVQPTACGLMGKPFQGTRCQASCASAKDEVRLCDRPTQCGATERCAPFRARGAELGACRAL